MAPSVRRLIAGTRLKIAKVAASGMSIDLLLRDQIGMLTDQGHRVTVVCAPGPFVPKLVEAGFDVRTVDLRRELSLLGDAKALFQLRRLFRREKFDVVHTHTPKAGLLGPLAAKLAGVPVVVHTIHGLLFHDRMSVLRRWLFWLPERMTATFADALLSQSREDLEVATRTRICSASKLRYLGNGIDIVRFGPVDATARQTIRALHGFGPDDVVIGTVGRLVAEKGFREFFLMAERLAETQRGIKFLVVGPTEVDQNDAIPEALITDLRRRGVITYLAWQSDMPRVYQAMDVFVCASYREGIPRACMEAAASQVPVIATDIRGCREVVVNGATGLLVPVRDADSLAAAVLRLCRSAEERMLMGTNGRRHICAHHDHVTVLARLRDFYAELSLPKDERLAAARAHY